jgi:hypothetical protein
MDLLQIFLNLNDCYVESLISGFYNFLISFLFCRSEQAPVCRDLSSVQLEVRRHLVGRRYRQALGRQNGRILERFGKQKS